MDNVRLRPPDVKTLIKQHFKKNYSVEHAYSLSVDYNVDYNIGSFIPELYDHELKVDGVVVNTDGHIGNFNDRGLKTVFVITSSGHGIRWYKNTFLKPKGKIE